MDYVNQSPEQIARDNIDKQLHAAGWAVQDKNKIDWTESGGVAVREYQTDAGPADYVLFVDRKPVGILEAKKEDEGYRLTIHENQTEGYAKSKLKYSPMQNGFCSWLTPETSVNRQSRSL